MKRHTQAKGSNLKCQGNPDSPESTGPSAGPRVGPPPVAPAARRRPSPNGCGAGARPPPLAFFGGGGIQSRIRVSFAGVCCPTADAQLCGISSPPPGSAHGGYGGLPRTVTRTGRGGTASGVAPAAPPLLGRPPARGPSDPSVRQGLWVRRRCHRSRAADPPARPRRIFVSWQNKSFL